MKVTYQGKEVSIYRLGKLTGCPLTSLYRAQKKGFVTGEELVEEARKHLIQYKGELITVRKLCLLTRSDYRSVKRRLESGLPVERAVADLVDRRGGTKKTKLTPSEVLVIYTTLFKKEKTQKCVAQEFGVHQATVSDIWRHKRWDWLTSPLRFQLEQLSNAPKELAA